jgi:hypothetical protein
VSIKFDAFQREDIKQRCGLYFQLDALEFFDSVSPFKNKRVLELAGSNIPRFITHDILGARQWICVDDIGPWLESYKKNRSSHYTTERFIPLADARPKDLNDDFVVFMGDAIRLPDWFWRKFDMVISIAALEHFSDVPSLLNECHRVSDARGVTLADFGPIWSGFAGHHVVNLKDKSGATISWNKNNPVPPWGHLLLSRMQMHQVLVEKMPEEEAMKAVKMIYDDDFINRNFAEDYLGFFLRSKFARIEYRKKPWTQTPSAEVQSALEQQYPGCHDFTQLGAQVALFKEEG